jgi:hypothetical protein
MESRILTNKQTNKQTKKKKKREEKKEERTRPKIFTLYLLVVGLQFCLREESCVRGGA